MEKQFHIKGYEDVLDPDWTMHLDEPSKMEFNAGLGSTRFGKPKNHLQ